MHALLPCKGLFDSFFFNFIKNLFGARWASFQPTNILGKNHWIYLDGRLVRKISKRHFFQDIKKSFHGVTQMGPKPHQIFFWKNISTNMVARGIRSFGILEGATGTLIEICPKFFCQFNADMWWAYAENFRAISWFM